MYDRLGVSENRELRGVSEKLHRLYSSVHNISNQMKEDETDRARNKHE
jgi:hypothetical protein